MNLNGISYFSTEMPFLNILKHAGSANGQAADDFVAWATAKSGANSTREEAYAPFDSNGYPTSMTASPPGGQQYTYYQTNIFIGINNVAPGVTDRYPKGPYRFQFTGQGSFTFLNDVTSLSNAVGCSIAGNVVTNSTPTSTCSVQVNISSATASGILLRETAITGTAGDYPHDVSMVDVAYTSQYDAGQYFHPRFLAMCANFKVFRFMDWLNTNNEFSNRKLITGATIAASTTSATLAQQFNATGSPTGTSLTLSSAWSFPSGTQTITFSDAQTRSASFTANSTVVTWTGALTGSPTSQFFITVPWSEPTATLDAIFGTTGEQKAVTCTLGSASVTWTGGLANAVAYQNSFTGQINISRQQSWSSRSPVTAFSWGITEVPYEVCLSLCNQIGAHFWGNCPLQYAAKTLTTGSVSNITSRENFIIANLNSPLKHYDELDNEVWNGAFAQYNIAGWLGGAKWPAQPAGGNNFNWNRNWFGAATALMGAAIQSAWGGSFASRAVVVMANQVSYAGSVKVTLQSAYWSASDGFVASNYPAGTPCISAIAVAPYFPSTSNSDLNTTDATNIKAQADGGIDYIFQLCYSNVLVGGTTPGTIVGAKPTSLGWLGDAEAAIASIVSGMQTDFPTLKVLGYEGGQQFAGDQPGGSPLGSTLVTNVNRDARAGILYTNFLTWWAANVGNTQGNILCLYSDVTLAANTAFGALESVQQSISPVASSPAKWKAIQNYIGFF